MKNRTISFTVSGLPPKKDGAKSMWLKSAERPRIMALRKAAVEAMHNQPPFTSPLHLKICIYANSLAGGLDNFITGICDGLMAAHERTPIDYNLWETVPEAARPNHPIAFLDDQHVTKIEAERFRLDSATPYYQVELTVME